MNIKKIYTNKNMLIAILTTTVINMLLLMHLTGLIASQELVTTKEVKIVEVAAPPTETKEITQEVVQEVEDPPDSEVEYIKYTTEEIELLERIAASETTGGDLGQKINAVQTVINRVESGRFKNTIEEVIMAKNQFSVITDGRFYSEKITDLDKEAVKRVIADPTYHEALFFKATWSDADWSNYKFLFTDGIHDFYTVQ